RLRVETTISLCLCFGGGVLLATCFIHMIPEVRESLEAVKRNGSSVISPSTSFPLAELFICCGFFLVYVIEEVAHRLFIHSETELKKIEEFSSEKVAFEEVSECSAPQQIHIKNYCLHRTNSITYSVATKQRYHYVTQESRENSVKSVGREKTQALEPTRTWSPV
ncbi:hypothetical protein L9F63_024404, partial [Diploptera punctata]